jgi:P pilus assembly chaperone PapD
MTRLAWMAASAVTVTAPAAAQGVMIAPHAVFIDHRQRSGAVTVLNPGTSPVEVSVAVFYGYTTVDSTGGLTLVSFDHPDSTQPSAAGWVQAFPRRLTIGPRERQTIRLLASPPPGLPDGEYWARLAFTAKAGEVPVTGITDTARIRIGLDLQVRSIIGLWYRKGDVHTGVAISDLHADRLGDSVRVTAELARQGNAAYLGTAHLEIRDARERVVGELRAPVTVFVQNVSRWTLPVTGTGPYHLWLELLTERDDFDDQRVVLQAPPVRDSVAVTVP